MQVLYPIHDMVEDSHHGFYQDHASFTGGTVREWKLSVLYEDAEHHSRNENKAFQASRLRS